MSVYRSQAHLDHPIERVWELVGNPKSYERWWPVVVEIRGDRFEVGDAYTQVARIAGLKLEYSRIVDRREHMRELRWSCPSTGSFQHWLLTEARGGTFVDMEMGIEPVSARYALFDRTVGKIFVKRWARQAIEGLRRELAR